MYHIVFVLSKNVSQKNNKPLDYKWPQKINYMSLKRYFIPKAAIRIMIERQSSYMSAAVYGITEPIEKRLCSNDFIPLIGLFDCQ